MRHLQRSEVREAEEFFHPGQKGSSAMPHKRNPVLSENLTGLARVVRGAVVPALENVTLWHERDITHSSVERVIAPGCDDRAGFRAGPPDRRDGEAASCIRSGWRRTSRASAAWCIRGEVLLALTQAGISREDAYAIVQRNAMKVWESDGQLSLLDLLKNDPEVSAKLSAEQLESLFNLDYHLKEVDTIFDRVFGAV